MAKLNVNIQNALTQIKLLIAEVKRLKTETSTVGSASAKSFQTLEANLKGVQTATKTAQTEFKRLKTDITSLKSQVKQLTTANKRLETRLGKVKKSAKQVGGAFGTLGKSLKTLIAGFGVVMGIQLFSRVIKNTFELIKTFDSLQFALERITKTTLEYANSMAFLTEISIDFGTELVATADRYVKFIAAAKQSGLTTKETEDIFRSMTKTAGVLGLKTDELRGIYLALEQMLSKGKVTTEELRRQLGERLPGAMGIMAASMGVTITELDKMMKKGEILSAVVLPKFAKTVEIAFGIQNVQRVETLVAAQNRMSTAWQLWIKTIGDSMGWLQTVFSWIESSINAINSAMMSRAQLLDSRIGAIMSRRQKQMDENAQIEIDRLNKLAHKRGEIYKLTGKQLEDALRANRAAQNTAHGKEKDDLIEGNALLIELAGEYADQIIELNKKVAEDGIEQAKSSYFDQLVLIKDIEKQIVDTKLANSKASSSGQIVNLKKLKIELRDADAHLATLKSEFILFLKILEKSTVSLPDITPPKGKVDTSELDFDIAYYKRLLKVREDFMNDEDNVLSERIDNLESSQMFRSKLYELQYQKELKLAGDNENKQLLAKQRYFDKLEDMDELYLENKLKIQSSGINEELQEIEARNKELMNTQLIALRERFESLKNATADEIEKYNTEVSRLRREFSNKTLREQAQAISEMLDLLGIHGEMRIELERKIQELLGKIVAGSKKEKVKTEVEYFNKIADAVEEFTQSVGDIYTSFLDRRIENIGAEIDAEMNKFDELILLNKDHASNVEALEKQKFDRKKVLDKKKLKEQQKQAKIQKVFAISDIAQKLAQILMNIHLTAAAQDAVSFGVLGKIWKAIQIPLAIATAAAQTASVLASPIPQYKKGVTNLRQDQLAMINDGISQEYINRKGNILTTDKKNAIVGLKTGDTVYKDYDEMIKKTILLSAIGNGNVMSEQDFNSFYDGITDSMKKGISKAKVRSEITINLNSNEEYKDSLSKWN